MQKRNENQSRYEAKVLELLLEQGGPALVAVFLNGAFYAVISWPVLAHEFLISWLIGIYAFSIFRYWYNRKLQKIAGAMSEEQVRKSLLKVKVTIAVSGFSWGLLGLMFDNSYGLHFAVTTFILAGMTAGAVAAYASSFAATCLFLYAALLPLIFRLLLYSSEQGTMMAEATILYLALMTVIAKNVNRKSRAYVTLSIENDELLNRLNDASHEIRTPVVTILGFAELLQGGQHGQEERNRYLSVIGENCKYLRRLVDNILLMGQSLIGEREQKPFIQQAELRAEIRTATSMVERRVQEKGIILEILVTPEIPEKLRLPVTEFQQILVNLLTNAVKFTQKGKVLVKAFRRQQELVVQVADSGIGIQPDSISRIFDPFFRERRSQVAQEEGSGLGLPIARRLAERIGGKLLLVESHPGRGSIFEFTIPLGEMVQPAGEEALLKVEKQLQGLNILFVDDSESIRLLYKTGLEAQGGSVTVCNNGFEALRLLNEQKTFDLVLMDISMPQMDGHVAIAKMRASGFRGPILALTAHTELEREKCISSGFNDFLSKSIPFKEVVPIVQKWAKPS